MIDSVRQLTRGQELQLVRVVKWVVPESGVTCNLAIGTIVKVLQTWPTFMITVDNTKMEINVSPKDVSELPASHLAQSLAA
jgi:hypothetical protein